MSKLWVNRATLELMYLFELARTFLYYRDAGRRELRQHRLAFNERAWREAAETIGASWRPIGGNIAEISLNGVQTRVRDYVSEIDGPVTCALLDQKPLIHKILREHNLPVPRHACFSLKNPAPAVAFLASIGGACVVKPANGAAGRGVTTGVSSARHLARAAAVAGVYGEELLIEEQVKGEVYRLLYLDGQIIDAFVRRPPAVVGDGRARVSALIRRTNDERLKGRGEVSQVLIPLDLDLRRTLARQGLSLRSIPATGRRVTLKTVVNDNSGTDNSTAMGLLHPSIIEGGRRAVEALGVRLAGLDIITADPTVPLEVSGGVILEVNGTPGFYYHYHKRDGAFPAALHVLRRLLIDDVDSPPRATGSTVSRFEGALV